MSKPRLEIHHGHKQRVFHFDHTTSTTTTSTTTSTTTTTTPTTSTTTTTTTTTTRRAVATKTGPNDAGRVVWALGECFFYYFFRVLLSLTLLFSHY
jgi:hypothetical protein